MQILKDSVPSRKKMESNSLFSTSFASFVLERFGSTCAFVLSSVNSLRNIYVLFVQNDDI